MRTETPDRKPENATHVSFDIEGVFFQKERPGRQPGPQEILTLTVRFTERGSQLPSEGRL